MMSSSMEKMMKTMAGTCTTSCTQPVNMDSSSTERSVKSRRTQSHSSEQYMMPMEPIQTLRRWCNHKMPPPDSKQQLPTLLRNDYISLTIHPITLYTHCTTMRTTEKGLRVHVESYIPEILQPDQEIGLQVHHTLVFWHLETCYCPSCIKEGTWSCTPARRMHSCLCFQSLLPLQSNDMST